MIDPSVLRAVNAEKMVTSIAWSERLIEHQYRVYLHVHLSPKLISSRTRRRHRMKQVTEYNRTTTETGTASCGIPPLIGLGKKTSPGRFVSRPTSSLDFNACLKDLDSSFSDSQAF